MYSGKQSVDCWTRGNHNYRGCGDTMGSDVGEVIGTIIMARSQLVHIVRSRVLHFCIGIVEVKILIQVLGMQEEKLSDVALIQASQLTYRVLACTKRAVHEMEKGGSRTNLNNVQGVP